MICNKTYLADILRFLYNKGFNLGDAFSKSLSTNGLMQDADQSFFAVNYQGFNPSLKNIHL